MITYLTFQPADENLNFDQQILEAAKSIAAAVQALVKAASQAQRELVAQGRVRRAGFIGKVVGKTVLRKIVVVMS